MRFFNPVSLANSFTSLTMPKTTTALSNVEFGSVLRQALSHSNGYLLAQLANIIMLKSSFRLMGDGSPSSGTSAANLLTSKLAPLLGGLPSRLISMSGTQNTQSAREKMTVSPRQNKAVSSQDRHDFDGLITQAAGRYGLDPDLVRAVVATESDFDPACVSSAGAMGLMQLMPDTARDLGVTDPFDPAQNIDGGTRYLAQMLEKFGGDLPKALAAYNWGPSNVERGGSLPAETRNYLKKVASLKQMYAQGFSTQA